MPVQSAVFEQYMIIKGYLFPDYEYNDKSNKNQSDDNMQGMQPGHEKVQSVKKNIPLAAESKDCGTWIDLFFDMVPPLTYLFARNANPRRMVIPRRTRAKFLFFFWIAVIDIAMVVLLTRRMIVFTVPK